MQSFHRKITLLMISQSRNDIVLEARQKGNKQQEDFFPE